MDAYRSIRAGRVARRFRPSRRVRLSLEHLETRLAPSDSQLLGPLADVAEGLGGFHATLVAGDPNGTPTDSPSNRVDANTTTSPYAGVGSVQVNVRRGTYIGTGTPLGARHVLTAAHVVDINSDGKANSKDGYKSLFFILNYGGDQSHKIPIVGITLHPNFTGFNRPSINDDLAILTLGSDLPGGVPTYGLPAGDLLAGTSITLVGYGRSGDGISGYTVNASFTVKRTGQNTVDAYYGQDDAGQLAANEVFRFDFDGPTGNGTFGGPTLGNTLETTLGGGDSGGPSFVGSVVVGVNTFTQGFTAPRFGSLGGGINVFPYIGWINSVLGASGSTDWTDDGSSGGKPGKGKSAAGEPAVTAMLIGLFAMPADALPAGGSAFVPQNFAIRFTATTQVAAATPAPAPLASRGAAVSIAHGGAPGVRPASWLGSSAPDDAERLDIQVEQNGRDAAAPAAPLPPAPAPLVPEPAETNTDDEVEAHTPSGSRALEVVFAEASFSGAPDDETAAAAPTTFAAPVLNRGAALAGLALLLGGASGRIPWRGAREPKRPVSMKPVNS